MEETCNLTVSQPYRGDYMKQGQSQPTPLWLKSKTSLCDRMSRSEFLPLCGAVLSTQLTWKEQQQCVFMIESSARVVLERFSECTHIVQAALEISKAISSVILAIHKLMLIVEVDKALQCHVPKGKSRYTRRSKTCAHAEVFWATMQISRARRQNCLQYGHILSAVCSGRVKAVILKLYLARGQNLPWDFDSMELINPACDCSPSMEK